jgi:hypothetical protein
MVCNVVSFYSEELLEPRPTPNLKDHTFSAVRNWLVNIFAVPSMLEAVSASETRRRDVHGDRDLVTTEWWTPKDLQLSGIAKYDETDSSVMKRLPIAATCLEVTIVKNLC